MHSIHTFIGTQCDYALISIFKCVHACVCRCARALSREHRLFVWQSLRKTLPLVNSSAECSITDISNPLPQHTTPAVVPLGFPAVIDFVGEVIIPLFYLQSRRPVHCGVSRSHVSGRSSDQKSRDFKYLQSVDTLFKLWYAKAIWTLHCQHFHSKFGKTKHNNNGKIFEVLRPFFEHHEAVTPSIIFSFDLSLNFGCLLNIICSFLPISSMVS